MSNDQTLALIGYIQQHALRYFPELVADQICVQLIDRQQRRSATLYRIQVNDDAQVRSIFVKVPVRNTAGDDTPGPDYQKPLLFPKVESKDMHGLQYKALVTIHKYFSGLDKAQLGAIRVLDYLPQYRAILMEELKDPNLRDLLLKESRLRAPLTRSGLTTAFKNAGMWLRAYHQMPKKEDVQVRQQHRNAYIESVSRLTDFLAGRAGDGPFFTEIALTLTDRASEILPEVLPLGLGHGDYAMRNLLVGPGFRVTVLDTFARWRTPIYEDIGYLLTALKTTYQQVISQGLAFSRGQLKQYEHAFLHGYFDQGPIPYPAIRLYEALALLDKWSSSFVASHRRGARLKPVSRMQAAWLSLYFKRCAKSLLEEIASE